MNKAQSFILDFYSKNEVKIDFPKKERQKIWDNFKAHRVLDETVGTLIPAMKHEVDSANERRGLLQSAVFSECVYAFHLAQILDLPHFDSHKQGILRFSPYLREILAKNHFVPRYSYRSKDGFRVLVQAGGPGSVDAIYVDENARIQVRIEFKEPGAKSQEPDLAYSAQGDLDLDADFLINYPQFKMMIAEAQRQNVNIFDLSDTNSNFHTFSIEAIERSLDENFKGDRSADVIVTEDRNGVLTAFLSEDLLHFVDPVNSNGTPGYKGEIRSAGRNHYPVWASNKLKFYLSNLNSVIDAEGTVRIPIWNLSKRKPRGGAKSDYSGWNITSVFFVRKKDVEIHKDVVKFHLDSVRQKKATIASHMYFKKLKYQTVKSHYSNS